MKALPYFFNKTIKIGIVSGHWNPLHLGHLEYMLAADAPSDKLIVIANNDLQITLKGRKPYMLEKDRIKFLSILFEVRDWRIWLSIDKDKNVCETLREIKGYYDRHDLTFYNSGDRKPSDPDNPSPETVLCAELGIKKEFIDLPKIYSSSKLIKNV